MKASVYTAYGPPSVLTIADVPIVEPSDDQIRVRVHATSVGFGDLAARNFPALTPRRFNMPLLLWLFSRLYFGLTKPRVHILGSEFAGVVDRVGKLVDKFRVGDEVFGFLGATMGGAAEYVCVKSSGCVAHKPVNMSFEEAATVAYGGTIALDLLSQVDFGKGSQVLIIGASGSIGSVAVQLAHRHFGAEVTGVAGPASLDYVRALGASHVLDYTKTDFSQSGAKYDVIFDVLGRSSWARARPCLKEGGRYLRASFKSRELLQMLWTHVTSQSKQVICSLAPGDQNALLRVKALIEAGELRSVVDRTFPLEQLAGAHSYAESGQKHGAIAVRVA